MGFASYLEKIREIRDEAISLRQRLEKAPPLERSTAVDVLSTVFVSKNICAYCHK